MSTLVVWLITVLPWPPQPLGPRKPPEAAVLQAAERQRLGQVRRGTAALADMAGGWQMPNLVCEFLILSGMYLIKLAVLDKA